MTPTAAALLLMALVALSWHTGPFLELALPKAPALARRLTYTFLVFELVRIPVERVLKWLLP